MPGLDDTVFLRMLRQESLAQRDRMDKTTGAAGDAAQFYRDKQDRQQQMEAALAERYGAVAPEMPSEEMYTGASPEEVSRAQLGYMESQQDANRKREMQEAMLNRMLAQEGGKMQRHHGIQAQKGLQRQHEVGMQGKRFGHQEGMLGKRLKAQWDRARLAARSREKAASIGADAGVKIGGMEVTINTLLRLSGQSEFWQPEYKEDRNRLFGALQEYGVMTGVDMSDIFRTLEESGGQTTGTGGGGVTGDTDAGAITLEDVRRGKKQ